MVAIESVFELVVFELESGFVRTTVEFVLQEMFVGWGQGLMVVERVKWVGAAKMEWFGVGRVLFFLCCFWGFGIWFRNGLKKA